MSSSSLTTLCAVFGLTVSYLLRRSRTKLSAPLAEVPGPGLVEDVARARGLEFVGMVYSEKAGDFVMQRAAKDISAYSLPRQLHDFEPFGNYAQENVRRLMVGSHGDSALFCFDYEYCIGGSRQEDGIFQPDHSLVSRAGIVGAQVPVSLPSMTIRPEADVSSLAKALGLRDLKVELDDFNRRYFVKAQDERRAYEILTPAIIEFLMTVPPLHWQIHENHVLITQPYGLDAEFAQAALDALSGFVDRIPGYVQSDFSAPKPNV